MATSCCFCFFLASIGFLPVVSPFLAPSCAATGSQSPHRVGETKIPGNTGKQEYLFGRMEAEHASCLPCHPLAGTGSTPDLSRFLWVLAAHILACCEEFVACGEHRVERRQQRERTATGTAEGQLLDSSEKMGRQNNI